MRDGRRARHAADAVPPVGDAEVPGAGAGRPARRRFRRSADHRPDTTGGLLDPSVDLVGAIVTQLRFDHGVTLALDASTHLRIETGFEFVAPDGGVTVLDPERDLDRMGPLLPLHRKRVAEFAADTTGDLAIAFSDGSALRCRPDDRDEAWALSLADGRLYVCTPGGEVAVWAGGGD